MADRSPPSTIETYLTAYPMFKTESFDTHIDSMFSSNKTALSGFVDIAQLLEFTVTESTALTVPEATVHPTISTVQPFPDSLTGSGFVLIAATATTGIAKILRVVIPTRKSLKFLFESPFFKIQFEFSTNSGSEK